MAFRRYHLDFSFAYTLPDLKADMKNSISNSNENLSSRKYILVFISLLLLTVLTVALSYLKHTLMLTIIIAFTIALFKGGLIVRYFMRLINEKPVIFWLLFLTFIFLFAILFLTFFEQQNQVNTNVLPFT